MKYASDRARELEQARKVICELVSNSNLERLKLYAGIFKVGIEDAMVAASYVVATKTLSLQIDASNEKVVMLEGFLREVTRISSPEFMQSHYYDCRSSLADIWYYAQAPPEESPIKIVLEGDLALYSLGETFGPVKCQGGDSCKELAWRIYLAPEEYAELPYKHGPDALRYIFDKNLGKSGCNEHTPPVKKTACV